MADTKKSSGSPDGEPVYLAIGFLRRPHGVGGEIIMDLHTDFPERLKRGKKLLVGEDHQLLVLEGIREHQKGVLVKFKGIGNSDEAGKFRNTWVYIKASDAPPLPDGQLYQHELLGFQVIDENDNPLGELVEILETGANDVYVVRSDSGQEILLPAIPSVILERDAARRLMRVHVLDGLIPGRNEE